MEAPLPNYRAGNTAPKLTPRRRPRVQPRPDVSVRFAKPNWTISDAMPFMVGIAVTLVMAFFALYLSNQISTNEANLSATSASTSKIQAQNNSEKQQISELSNADRLNEIAQKYGLNMDNKNIRNVK